MKRFFKSRGGATAIEYSLIAAAVALMIVTGATQIGEATLANFNAVEAGF